MRCLDNPIYVKNKVIIAQFLLLNCLVGFANVSGRLLVPSLDFWRNQIAVYDAVCDILNILFVLFQLIILNLQKRFLH